MFLFQFQYNRPPPNRPRPLVPGLLSRYICENEFDVLLMEVAMHLLVTGAGGLVGRILSRGLSAAGHQITPLVRRRPGNAAPQGSTWWDPQGGSLDLRFLEGQQGVIHLAGENIASGRWTTAKKRRILESRVRGTELLAGSLARLETPPRVLISASAVGIYGSRSPEEMVTEQSARGAGFLADVCRQWEAATGAAAEAGIRVINLRFGVVLDPDQGALAKMLPAFRLGLGGPVGNGRQMMSWIAADELPALVSHLLAHESIRGPVNAVSPHPVSNMEFGTSLGRVLSRPAILPLPAFAARLAFGEMARELLLGGVAVLPQVLLDSGYRFANPELEPALREMLAR
jgi:uncharacterized protein (TIGR01777 family)